MTGSADDEGPEEAPETLTLLACLPLTRRGLATPCFATHRRANRIYTATCEDRASDDRRIARFEPLPHDARESLSYLPPEQELSATVGDPWLDIFLWDGLRFAGTRVEIMSALGPERRADIAATSPFTILSLASGTPGPDQVRYARQAYDFMASLDGTRAAETWLYDTYFRSCLLRGLRRQLGSRQSQPDIRAALRDCYIAGNRTGLTIVTPDLIRQSASIQIDMISELFAATAAFGLSVRRYSSLGPGVSRLRPAWLLRREVPREEGAEPRRGDDDWLGLTSVPPMVSAENLMPRLVAPARRHDRLPRHPVATPSVMISSTFIDLEEHRRAAIDALLTARLFPVVMDHTIGTSDDHLISSSLAMLDSAAAYICLIGARYGQILPSAVHNPAGLSLIELEFRRAQEKRIPTILLLMGDKHPIPRDLIERDPEKQRKLEAFRASAKKLAPAGDLHRIYKTFENLDDFKVAIAQAAISLRDHLTHEATPPDFSHDETTRRLLAGEPIPPTWRPFVTEVVLGLPVAARGAVYGAESLAEARREAAGTYLDSAAPLAQFPNLARLNLWGTPISDLRPLAALTNLQSLDLDRTQVTDLTPLAALANLQLLHLNSTQVTDLTPLASLTNLQSLDLRNTKVTDLTPLAALPNLKHLNIGGLPKGIESTLPRRTEIEIIR